MNLRNLDLPAVSPLREKLAAVGLLVLVFVALAAGYWIGSARAPVPENTAPAPEVRQADGSLVLARVPVASPPPAPHQLPKGSGEVRRATTTMRSTSRPDCPPMTQTTSLVQDGDGLRMVTSSPDGEVIAGTDMVFRPLNLAPPLRPWAAGITYEISRDLYGIWIERDFGRLRIGAEIQQRDYDTVAAWVRAGLTF